MFASSNSVYNGVLPVTTFAGSIFPKTQSWRVFSGTLKIFEAFKTDSLSSFSDLYAFVRADGEYNLYFLLTGCGFAYKIYTIILIFIKKVQTNRPD